MPTQQASFSILPTATRLLSGRGAQCGAGAVEFALILPFLFLLTIGIIEMSNIYFKRNQMNEIVRDATRRFAVGALQEADVEAFVLTRLEETAGLNGAVQVAEVEDGDIVDVSINLGVPFADVIIFDQLIETLWSSAPEQMTVSATMMKH